MFNIAIMTAVITIHMYSISEISFHIEVVSENMNANIGKTHVAKSDSNHSMSVNNTHEPTIPWCSVQLNKS